MDMFSAEDGSWADLPRPYRHPVGQGSTARALLSHTSSGVHEVGAVEPLSFCGPRFTTLPSWQLGALHQLIGYWPVGTSVGNVVINCRLTTRSTASPSGSPEQSRIASFTDKGGAEWARCWPASRTLGKELAIPNHNCQENGPSRSSLEIGKYNS